VPADSSGGGPAPACRRPVPPSCSRQRAAGSPGRHAGVARADKVRCCRTSMGTRRRARHRRARHRSAGSPGPPVGT